MTVNINGTNLYINDSLYGTAEQISNFILKTIQSKTSANHQIQLYYATLLCLHTQTSEMLHLIDQDEIDLLMKAWDISKKPVPKPEE